MSNLPPVLAAGGSHQWGVVPIDWTFELGDGWDLDDVSNVLLVPFVGGHVVVLRLANQHSPWAAPSSPVSTGA